MSDLRCGNCNYWLGESPQALIFVAHVSQGSDAELAPPRDLRLCKACGRVNVFVPKSDLDARRRRAVAS